MCFDNALLAITNIANYVEESNIFFGNIWGVGRQWGRWWEYDIVTFFFSFSSPVLNIFVVLNEKLKYFHIPK